jgi:hypothetical protein
MGGRGGGETHTEWKTDKLYRIAGKFGGIKFGGLASTSENKNIGRF